MSTGLQDPTREEVVICAPLRATTLLVPTVAVGAALLWCFPMNSWGFACICGLLLGFPTGSMLFGCLGATDTATLAPEGIEFVRAQAVHHYPWDAVAAVEIVVKGALSCTMVFHMTTPNGPLPYSFYALHPKVANNAMSEAAYYVANERKPLRVGPLISLGDTMWRRPFAWLVCAFVALHAIAISYSLFTGRFAAYQILGSCVHIALGAGIPFHQHIRRVSYRLFFENGGWRIDPAPGKILRVPNTWMHLLATWRARVADQVPRSTNSH